VVRRLVLAFLLLSTLLLAACGGGSGLPTQPGSYQLKEKSVSFDGDRYSFYWADATGALHRVSTNDLKLKLDDKNELEITPDKHAVLHLKQDEPVTVEGRDRQGDFGSFWYPFLIGSMLSRGGGGPVIINNQPAPAEYHDPTYRYPPTDRFDRGDTIGGNVTSTSGRPPDYTRLPPVGGTVAGQAGGTGGGNAATNKAELPSASSAQSGGTGSGSAAIDKAGSFRRGDQGYDAKVNSGQIRTINPSRPSVGGGATGDDRAPSISTSRPSGGDSSVPRINTGRGSVPSSGSVPKISTGRRR
jgi:hypothetical protein